jgi:hypothetical protein
MHRRQRRLCQYVATSLHFTCCMLGSLCACDRVVWGPVVSCGIVSGRASLFAALRAAPELEAALGHRWAEVWATLDTNHDDKLSWHELLYYMYHSAPATKQVYVPKHKTLLLNQIGNAFRTLDKDQDGTGLCSTASSRVACTHTCALHWTGRVSRHEFFAALRDNPDIEALLGGHKWAEIFAQLQAEADGYFTFKEFRDYVFKRTPTYLPPAKLHLKKRAADRKYHCVSAQPSAAMSAEC